MASQSRLCCGWRLHHHGCSGALVLHHRRRVMSPPAVALWRCQSCLLRPLLLIVSSEMYPAVVVGAKCSDTMSRAAGGMSRSTASLGCIIGGCWSASSSWVVVMIFTSPCWEVVGRAASHGDMLFNFSSYATIRRMTISHTHYYSIINEFSSHWKYLVISFDTSVATTPPSTLLSLLCRKTRPMITAIIASSLSTYIGDAVIGREWVDWVVGVFSSYTAEMKPSTVASSGKS